VTVRQHKKELIALVADKSIECALRGVISRPEALGIRPIASASDIYAHPERDPACLRKAHAFLRPYALGYRRALVIFDRDGCGRAQEPRKELERQVEHALANAGWHDRAAAVVIDPELENWVWSDSPEVDRVLGWAEGLKDLRQWVSEQGFSISRGKPERPKEAMEAALRHARKPRSSGLFTQLAQCVSLERCQDQAFGKLRTRLRDWFSPHGTPLEK
jgi:hypothetical protein